MRFQVDRLILKATPSESPKAQQYHPARPSRLRRPIEDNVFHLHPQQAKQTLEKMLTRTALWLKASFLRFIRLKQTTTYQQFYD